MKYKKYFRKTSLKQKGIGEHFLNEIASKKPKNFLEIGVFHGVTARNVCELLYSIHENDFKCELCHLQAKTFAILPKEIFSISEKKINFKKATNYQFLYKHQQLSFSLRGPPFFNFL